MRKLKIGVIGAGGIARRKAIPAIAQCQNCEVVAVMNPSKSDEIARQFGISKAYSNEADLLADPDVAAVYIASPVNVHARQIIAAARAGKHVLCEKPLTMTLDEADAAIEACEDAHVIMQEGYMMKFHGAHRAIKALIDGGRIGKIVYMRAQLSCWYPPIKGAWRQDPRTGGGGALFDMATHLYDLLEHFAGPVRRLACFTRSHVQGYASEDLATTLLEFAGGAQGTVDVSFCVPDEASKTRLEIYGSGGSILSEGTIGQGADGTLQGMLSVGSSGYDASQNKDLARAFQTIPYERVNPYTAQFEYFADCVMNRRAPEINNAVNARHIVELALQAYASSRENRVITFGEQNEATR
jgi:predicted dehydrogenase